MNFGTVRIYAPEKWGTLEKFNKFYSNTFDLSKIGERSVAGAENHFQKAITLRNLAQKLAPNLDIDEEEMEQHGYSHAINSKELSAVIEGVVLELYSSIDCTRQVITEIYSTYQGVPKKSTRRYFQRIKEGKIDSRFPAELVLAVTEATWYEQFRAMRDELTHQDTGTCHRDRETGKVRYRHDGIKIEGKPLIIEDIFEHTEQKISQVNQFIGRVFAHLYDQLDDDPVLQYCGIFEGRFYTRYVKPSEAVDFHSGTCDSKRWFDLEENPTCIFAEECGAYKNATD